MRSSGLDPKLDWPIRSRSERHIEEIFGRVIDEEGCPHIVPSAPMLEQINGRIIVGPPPSPGLRDETVTEIMVNGPRQVYIELATAVWN